jgi:prepilin-type N-terminal cleavage/methylation domain-containing protein
VTRRPWAIGAARKAASCHAKKSFGHAEGGFTLVELLVVSTILPLIVGAIAVALISVLSLQGGVSSRISDSTDAQIVSAHLDQDVQSAAKLTTSATATQCGPEKQLLGLEWTYIAQSGSYQTVVSYVSVPQATTPQGTTYSLVRQYCASGASVTPTSSSTVSAGISATQLPPTIAPIVPTDYNLAASTGWISTRPITGVTFAIREPGTNYTYTLVALPGEGSSTKNASPQSTIPPPTTACGFATPGTGTYASTLCFVDFSSYSASAAAGPACQPMSAAVANTPFTITLCLSVSGSAVVAHSTPTYFAPPTSEAFLGNNGFYAGIPGNPALYQLGSGTTMVTITNIQVLDSSGQSATGWELVTGDAESTDAGESMTWTTSARTPLNLLPNSSVSQIGNACSEATLTNFAAIYLTGLGTQSVKCAATVSSDKTGTVMLEASTPTSLSVQMVGGGREALFIGLLLP